jgi:hypothetical protein
MKMLRNVKRGFCSCCLFFVLLGLALVVGLVVVAVRTARADTPAPPAREIVLAVDNSPSMWDCDGIGTDPQLLRVDAARLFIQYLGADSSAAHRLALLHFGGDVRELAGLTDLADPAGRERLLAAVSRPEPIRWTDQWLALESARELLVQTGTPGSRRLIVLLTDGEPAPKPVTAAGLSEALYLRQLEQSTAMLGQAGITLAVVLLSDQSTSCGRAVAATWTERWARLAALTPGGALYTANQAEELLPVYHAIVRELAGAAAGAAPATTATLTQGQPLRVPVPVDGTLVGLVITIWKAEAATTVQVLDPSGWPVTAAHSGVTVTGGDAGNREQVWRVAQPEVGLWQVALHGRGRVSVWQDRIAPPPTATALPTSTATATATRTATPEPTPTRTQTPTLPRSPTATASATTSAAPTLTNTPSAAPQPSLTAAPPLSSALASAAPPAGGVTPTEASPVTRPLVWPWFLGVSTVLGAGGVVVARHRRHGPYLGGQLVLVAVPDGAPLSPPRDLGRERRRQVYLGQRGAGAWRLPGWPGMVRLTADRNGGTSLTAVTGEVTLDEQPARHTVPLLDGAIIGCGGYRIRYDNLLDRATTNRRYPNEHA